MVNNEDRCTLNARIAKVIVSRTCSEVAIGWLRYEAVRNLSVKQYKKLFCQSLAGSKSFDDLVDELIVKGAK